jgi:sigma-B regulation protein RsbU (phosphoserine phosphatase)
MLTMIEGNQRGEQWELRRAETVIGRQQGCDILLNNGAVSRNHARILENHGTYYIEDMRSRNATYLNEQRLERKTELQDNDRIGICDVVFLFQTASSSLSSLGGREATQAGMRLNDLQVDEIENHLPEIVSVPAVNGSHIPAVVNGPDVIDKSSILSSYSLTTGGYLRLLGNPEAKLKALIDLSSNLSQLLTVELLLPKLLDCLMRAFPLADRAVVLLNDLEKNQLQIRGIRLRDDESAISPPLSTTIIKYALRHKQIVLSEDVLEDARFSTAESVANLRIRSVMCAPLLSATGQLLGIIQIDTANVEGRFITEDLELLVCLSNQASLAIDNVNLHKQALAQRDLERDLEFANSVQMGFLPTERPNLPPFQFYDFYEPAQHVGGDFFDYIKLPDGRLAVAVGDVAGKGVPAALLMARLYSMTRYSLLTSATAALAVTDLNASISSSGLGHRFITFVLAVLDPKTGQVSIVNAGHLPPLLRHASGATEAIHGADSGLPLGVSGDCVYEQTELIMNPGDSLFLLTDGLTEAMNPQNEIYTFKRIVEFLKNHSGSVEHLGEALVANVDSFCAGRSQSDDICLVCFRRTDTDSSQK